MSKKTYFFGFFGVKITSIYCYIKYKENCSSQTKFNLVFDLDETLIYSAKTSKINRYNNNNSLKPTILDEDRVIWQRPFFKPTITLLKRFNNIHLMTKGSQKYADKILEKLNIGNYFIEKKYSHDCDICKDLRKFNFNIEKSILIDDLNTNQCKNQNIYHIPKFNMYTFYDFELLKLFYYILWLNIKDDIKKLK